MSSLQTTTGRENATESASGRAAARAFIAVCWVQGLYFLLTGVWPLVNIDTFLMVTGPKTDLWLVQTVGVLIAVIALVILYGAWRGRPSVEIALLAVGSSVALAGVDIVFVAGDVIPPVYLIDAAAEAVLLAGWAVVLVLHLRSQS